MSDAEREPYEPVDNLPDLMRHIDILRTETYDQKMQTFGEMEKAHGSSPEGRAFLATLKDFLKLRH